VNAQLHEDAGSWTRIALVTVPLIWFLGSASGWLSGSGYGNDWFDALAKPAFMPPGWMFGVAWTILYILLGFAVALILAESSDTPRRRGALILFFTQLALNYAWSPIFFAGHDITLAKFTIYLMAALAAAAAGQFYRIRPLAGLLMLPYLAWLIFAATLTAAIEDLNPGAGQSLMGI
jgi:tryptophan-rich sensory protein